MMFELIRQNNTFYYFGDEFVCKLRQNIILLVKERMHCCIVMFKNSCKCY